MARRVARIRQVIVNRRVLKVLEKLTVGDTVTLRPDQQFGLVEVLVPTRTWLVFKQEMSIGYAEESIARALLEDGREKFEAPVLYTSFGLPVLDATNLPTAKE